MLESDDYLADVRADEAEARALGIQGVPFFVVDRRYGVSGAQPAELLLGVLREAWTEAAPGGADRFRGSLHGRQLRGLTARGTTRRRPAAGTEETE